MGGLRAAPSVMPMTTFDLSLLLVKISFSQKKNFFCKDAFFSQEVNGNYDQSSFRPLVMFCEEKMCICVIFINGRRTYCVLERTSSLYPLKIFSHLEL